MGCGSAGPGPDNEACERDTAPSLELGAAADAFEPVEPGTAVELVHGSQGGYHIELAFRATGLDPSDLAAGTLEGWVDGSLMATSSPWLQFRCNPATGTYDAWPTILVYDAEEPQSLDGVTTEVEALVVDASGAEFTASLTLTIDDPNY